MTVAHKVKITYCAECGYEPQTLDLAKALMLEFGARLSCHPEAHNVGSRE